MKIALVTETYPPEVNGVAMTNQRLVRGLIERGHTIRLIKPFRADGQQAHSSALQIYEVFGIPIPNYSGLKMGLPSPGQLEQYFEQMRPDIVHIATEGPLGFSALRAARKLGIATSSTFHTNFQDYCADYGAAFLQKPMMAYLRWFHNSCGLTTVPDPSLIQKLYEDGVERLEMLGRGADTRLFNPARRSNALRAEWGVTSPETPVALYVGRVAAEKNIPLTLKAWLAAKAIRPDLLMVVVGDGPILKQLKRDWPDVHFAGMRFDEDLATHYASADLFLFASTSETFGNVVVEAMSSGLITVTYDYAAGRQFIKSAKNGQLVPFDDAEAFCNAAKKLVNDPSNWREIGQAARLTAEEYPWSKTIDRFEYLLEKAIRYGNSGEFGTVPASIESTL